MPTFKKSAILWQGCDNKSLSDHGRVGIAGMDAGTLQEDFMLVLRRKRGEAIRISDDIRVVLIEVGDGSARIGIDAPQDLRILREEVFDLEFDYGGEAGGA